MPQESSAPVLLDHRTVIDRSLCLSALAVRGTIESAVQLAPTQEDAHAYAGLSHRLSTWLNEQDFTALFTANELEALSKSAGGWGSGDHEAQGARVEALGTLLWAISLQDKLPPLTQPFAVPDLEPLIGWPASALFNPNSPALKSFPHNPGTFLQGTTRLRLPAVIKGERASMDCWQWRVQVAALQRAKAPSPNGQPYELMIAIAAEEAHTAAAIPSPVRNDFAIGGRPFGALAESDQAKIGRIVEARRTALHWVSGYASEWDALPARTMDLEPVAA